MRQGSDPDSMFLFVFLWLPLECHALDPSNALISGVVLDPMGAVVPHADVSLLNARQAIVGVTRTDAQGGFSFSDISNGTYMLVVHSRGFAERRMAISVGLEPLANLHVSLEPRPIKDQVTVTADVGLVESVDLISQQVNVISDKEIGERTKAVLAEVAKEEAGIHLQRTSPTVAGIYVRGLTGNKVNVFVDGVRYSNSTQRSGINTFLDLVEPSSLEAVEVLRGPGSAQYGSDALGGSIQLLSRGPSFYGGGSRVRGRSSTSFNSADVSLGSSLSLSYGRENLGMVAHLNGRRVNTLRPGQEIDSHAAVTRFFGLRSDAFGGPRLSDTAFTQYAGTFRMNYSPMPGSQFIAYYARSQQDGGKRYDQLLGGDGNLVADLRNLMLDLFYLKYDRTKLAGLDSLTATYSFNTQREERVNQGGNGNSRASINHEYERTSAHGIQALGARHWGRHQSLLLGAEYYREGIRAPSFAADPVTGTSSARRPRIPNGTLYQSGGVYLQDVVDVAPQRLRLLANVRYSAASYQSRAADSPLVVGKPLWPDDSLRVSDVTFRAGMVQTPVEGFSLSAYSAHLN